METNKHQCTECYGLGSVRMFDEVEYDHDGNEIDIDDGAAMTCPECDGKGYKEGDQCSECSGSGGVPVTCGICNGDSIVDDEKCEDCEGTGVIVETCVFCSGEGYF